jgi:energy-coupling factor transport system ATP-binding protein
VGFRYPGGPVVFDGVSFEVRPGEAVGLFGPNGSGKSTLLRLAMALEQPMTGTIRTLERATTGLHPENLAPRVGFLFQQPERQLFATSVRGECAVALQLAGWSASRIEGAVSEVLEELGLAEVATEHPYDLPLPRRRLVALASILVAGPELVLLDEPTAGLDATSRERVIKVIRDRVAGGLAALVITHDAIFAHETLGRAIQLREGYLIDDGPARNVLEGTRMTRPAALAVAIELGIPTGRDGRDAVASELAKLASPSSTS